MRISAIFLMAALSWSAPAHADATLKLVTGSDYPPYVDDTLPGGGQLVVLVQQAFRAAGITTDLTIEPWRRGYEGVQAMRFDASFPYVRTTERDAEVLYSDPLVIVRQHLIVATANQQAAMDPGWILGRRVCSANGYGLQPWLQIMLDKGQVQRVTPAQQRSCLSMVAADRADFMVEDDRIANARLDESAERERVRIVPGPPASQSELHLIVSRQHPRARTILDSFNQGLARVRDTLPPTAKPHS